MIVAFGTSTPTSITVVATSTSSSPALNRAITLAALGGLQPPVEAADAVPLELGAAQPLGLGLGRAGDLRLRLLDQRAHDVRLPAVVEMPPEPPVGLGAAVLGDPRGHDRLAVRRRQRELADVEVAVDGQRQRARDRRRGQVQDVRAASLDERASLADAEAVLLVDDGDGEVVEVDLLLDERVRADDELGVARRDAAAGPPRARVARSELVSRRHADAERRTELVDRQEVLLGERLRRGHERSLVARLDGAQERVQGDDRLPGGHVSLQQPLHRDRAREICVESPRSRAPGRP